MPNLPVKKNERLKKGNPKLAHFIQPFWQAKGRKKGHKLYQHREREGPGTKIRISDRPRIHGSPGRVRNLGVAGIPARSTTSLVSTLRTLGLEPLRQTNGSTTEPSHHYGSGPPNKRDHEPVKDKNLDTPLIYARSAGNGTSKDSGVQGSRDPYGTHVVPLKEQSLSE